MRQRYRLLHSLIVSASLVHLVRHGEVENPHHVVYADLPGYGLSAQGLVQARSAGARLAAASITRVISSPLLRATQTAAEIAVSHEIQPEKDEQLTEWAVGIRWAGVRWDDLEEVFPGELNAYLETPLDLEFGSESLQACGERVAAAVRAAAAAMNGGELVVVSHQDPIHAGHLALAGRTPADYHADKPAHAGIVTLQPDATRWAEAGYWQPEQGQQFPPLPAAHK